MNISLKKTALSLLSPSVDRDTQLLFSFFFTPTSSPVILQEDRQTCVHTHTHTFAAVIPCFIRRPLLPSCLPLRLISSAFSHQLFPSFNTPHLPLGRPSASHGRVLQSGLHSLAWLQGRPFGSTDMAACYVCLAFIQISQNFLATFFYCLWIQSQAGVCPPFRLSRMFISGGLFTVYVSGAETGCAAVVSTLPQMKGWRGCGSSPPPFR